MQRLMVNQCWSMSEISKYPLLPFSQLVYDMTRWMPGVYRFPINYVWRDGAKDFGHIENAVRTALANHPVFQMRTDWRGMHYTAPLKDILHGPYHDIDFSIDKEDVIIKVSASRILGDGKSAEILIEDIQRAYNGLPLEPDDYWGYVAECEQRKSNLHYLKSRDWLINEFADSSVPVRPTIDRRWLTTLLPPKAGVCTSDYSAIHEQIEQLKEEQFISYEGIFSLAVALAIADYCGTDNAALTWAYEGRETPEEHRIFGSLHRDIPFQINHKSEIINHKSDLIRMARNQIRSGIAHCDYPYTLIAPYNKRWNYAVNVLRVPELEYESKYAYALLDVEIHEKAESLRLVYRYSATHYKPESIHRFAALVRKYVEWLID